MKHFTLDEAQALVPQFERTFATIGEIRTRASVMMDHVKALEAEKAADQAQLAIEKSQLLFLAESLEEVLRGIEKTGAVVKGLDPGLVDFPAELSGEEIFMCWRQGEKAIEHYHSTDEGFSGRKQLPKERFH